MIRFGPLLMKQTFAHLLINSPGLDNRKSSRRIPIVSTIRRNRVVSSYINVKMVAYIERGDPDGRIHE